MSWPCFQSVGGVEALVHDGQPFGPHTVHSPVVGSVVQLPVPPPVTAMLVTLVTRTSLAVQVSAWVLPCAAQTSWMHPSFSGFTADAGWATRSSPPTARIPTRIGNDPARKCQDFLCCFISFPPCRSLGIHDSLLCRPLTARATINAIFHDGNGQSRTRDSLLRTVAANRNARRATIIYPMMPIQCVLYLMSSYALRCDPNYTGSLLSPSLGKPNRRSPWLSCHSPCSCRTKRGVTRHASPPRECAPMTPCESK